MPNLKMSASYCGASSSLTLLGPPEIMIALYSRNLDASVFSGNISDKTFNSRTRLSITCDQNVINTKKKYNVYFIYFQDNYRSVIVKSAL